MSPLDSIFSLSILILFTTVAAVAQVAEPIFAPDSKAEQVFSGGFWLEGPAVAPDGTVYFSDITYSSLSGMQAGHIWRYDPVSGSTSIFRSPSGMSNGIAFDARGDMLVAEGADFGGRRITRTDMKSGMSYIVAGLYNGRRFNSPNDLVTDKRGRIYFTDPRYTGMEPIEQPVMGTYRIDTDGSVHLSCANLWKPNGIAIAPDQKTLYVVEVGDYNLNIVETLPNIGGPPCSVHAYDLLEDGSVRYRKAVVTFPAGSWADGMTVDDKGNLFVGTGSSTGNTGVQVYSPDGRRIAFLATPETAVNLDFGRGENADILYITCSRHPNGSGPWTPPPTNGLYRVRLQKSETR